MVFYSYKYLTQVALLVKNNHNNYRLTKDLRQKSLQMIIKLISQYLT